jgi:hypothetical protein
MDFGRLHTRLKSRESAQLAGLKRLLPPRRPTYSNHMRNHKRNPAFTTRADTVVNILAQITGFYLAIWFTGYFLKLLPKEGTWMLILNGLWALCFVINVACLVRIALRTLQEERQIKGTKARATFAVRRLVLFGYLPALVVTIVLFSFVYFFIWPFREPEPLCWHIPAASHELCFTPVGFDWGTD